MNWLVCWYVVTTTMTTCPDFKADPYTGQLPSTSCAVAHMKFDKVARTQWFETKAEAKKFVDGAPKYIKPRMVVIDAEDKAEADSYPFAPSTPTITPVFTLPSLSKPL